MSRTGVGTLSELPAYEAERRGVRAQPTERTFPMATTKRQTMSKITRERELKEKREMKKERKAEKKLAAAEAAAVEAESPGTTPPE
jgi:hypothetical protein